MKLFLLALSALLLSVCALGNGKPVIPYDAWFLGVLTPNYMEVWVESVDVIDQQGLVFEHLSEGNSAIQTPANGKGKPAGWPKRVGSGAGKPLWDIDLPEFLFVRWQSLAEPQTYHAKVIIPQWVRDEMVKPKIVPERTKDKQLIIATSSLSVWLPAASSRLGFWVVAWIRLRSVALLVRYIKKDRITAKPKVSMPRHFCRFPKPMSRKTAFLMAARNSLRRSAGVINCY